MRAPLGFWPDSPLTLLPAAIPLSQLWLCAEGAPCGLQDLLTMTGGDKDRCGRHFGPEQAHMLGAA